MKEDLLIFYCGFKKTPVIDISKINPVKQGMFLNQIKEGKVFLLQGDFSIFVNLLLEKVKAKDIKGFYFPELFEQLINNEIKLSDLTFSKYVCVYGIGKELAKDKTYSGVVLSNIVDRCLKEGSILFLEGITKASLKNEYKTDFNVESLSLGTLK